VSREPVPLSDSLSAVLRSLRPPDAPSGPQATAAVMGDVFGLWEQAVGAAVAAHVQPVKLQGTNLVVEVDDPAWATQLRFLERTMRERLLEIAGADIQTVEVRVRRR
jgi:predicted nucleic acid-binding Zn ribbon protein